MNGRSIAIAAVLAGVAILAIGSWRNPEFWRSADRHGDQLMAKHQYREAARTYRNPWRIAVAQYRNGDFEDAAKTFARVPGETGAFNQGNAWLMHGAYDSAVKSYDRALGFRPQWKLAEDNKALALARKKLIDDAGENRDQESADAYKPDELVFDQKGDDQKSKPKEINGEQLSDADLRATWLRRVQTSPGDFLRAKFAYQASREDQAAEDAEAVNP